MQMFNNIEQKIIEEYGCTSLGLDRLMNLRTRYFVPRDLSYISSLRTKYLHNKYFISNETKYNYNYDDIELNNIKQELETEINTYGNYIYINDETTKLDIINDEIIVTKNNNTCKFMLIPITPIINQIITIHNNRLGKLYHDTNKIKIMYIDNPIDLALISLHSNQNELFYFENYGESKDEICNIKRISIIKQNFINSLDIIKYFNIDDNYIIINGFENHDMESIQFIADEIREIAKKMRTYYIVFINGKIEFVNILNKNVDHETIFIL